MMYNTVPNYDFRTHERSVLKFIKFAAAVRTIFISCSLSLSSSFMQDIYFVVQCICLNKHYTLKNVIPF